MKFRVALIAALLTLAVGAAQADTIKVVGKHSVGQTVIIRGAPARCHETRPLIINVRESLRNGTGYVPKCEAELRRAYRDRSLSITNIIVFAGRHEHLYIKRH